VLCFFVCLFLSLFCVFCPILHVSLDRPFSIAALFSSNIYLVLNIC
jgi:hypothetical protein